jgi:nitronate monooxygenase
VTTKDWASRALDQNVDGLICVNNRAGGHAGTLSPQKVFEDLVGFNKPLVCAGGVGQREQFLEMLDLGYAGVQMGTRFIATQECQAHADYKNAILKAKADDIVLTDKISGVPVSIIKTPYIEKIGIKAGWLARRMLRGRKTKHWMRMFYTIQSLVQLKRASLQGASYKDYWQAGKSVDGIEAILPVKDVMHSFVD